MWVAIVHICYFSFILGLQNGEERGFKAEMK